MEEKYQSTKHSIELKELPQGALASYLGISQKTLSVVQRELVGGIFTPPYFT